MRPTSWLMLLEAVVIVAVNVITIVIFTTTSRLRSRQYALIVSLAVADLLVGLLSVPLQIVSQEIPTFKFPSQFSKANLVQDTVLGTASLFGLAALAIERAHATYFPFSHHTLSIGSYAIGIAAVWALTLANGIVLYHTITTHFPYYIIAKIVSAGITLTVICGAYVLIVVKVRCMSRTSHQATTQGNKKLTTTLSIVTIISLVTWVPYQAMLLAFVAFGTKVTNLYWTFRTISKVLHYGNSLANFFVYAFRMREFKVELLRRFRWGSRQVSPNDGTRGENSMKTRSIIDLPIPLQSQR